MMTPEMVVMALISISALALIIFWKGLQQKYKMLKDKKRKIDGDLIIDTKDPNKDVFRFELYYSPEQLMEDKDRQYVTFKIIRND